MPLAHLPFDPYRTSMLTRAFDEAWERLRSFGDDLANDAEDARTRLAFLVMRRAHSSQETGARIVEDVVAELRSQRVSN